MPLFFELVALNHKIIMLNKYAFVMESSSSEDDDLDIAAAAFFSKS
jgi:hypothetical protein